MSTAAIVLIGDELLSGKFVDENARYLIPRLRGLGVRLKRVALVSDEARAIGDEVRLAAALADHVFTSGGVGPTHDDITVPSIAAAFGVPVERPPELEALVRSYFGERLTEAHMRLADVPAGTELVYGGDIRWPVTVFRNIYILPGIPQIFRLKFESMAERFRDGVFHLRCLYLNADEGAIAEVLRAAEQRFETVSIGSYPRFGAEDHKVKITVEGRETDPVNVVVEGLLESLPAGAVVRCDPPV
jgi:molybdenum cofactor synthesis domain-containing protein